MNDARFEDRADKPLRLIAFDASDLQVISTMVQDAISPVADVSWRSHERRFVLLLNRFRWEIPQSDVAERVQAVLSFEDVEVVQIYGFDPLAPDFILSLLDIGFEAGSDGMGHCLVTLAGGGVIRLQVEALEVSLRDVTRPYTAPSGLRPNHD